MLRRVSGTAGACPLRGRYRRDLRRSAAHRWAVADERVGAIDLEGLCTDRPRFSTVDHLYFPHDNGQVRPES
jgi:hypothetical protein